jgi:hypothetical protein
MGMSRIPLEFSKGTHFQAGQRMGRRRALFDSTDVQDGPIEVHLIPSESRRVPTRVARAYKPGGPL